MPITLQTLKAAIRPAKTALVLGAGASVPSGAPTAAQLAEQLWRDVAKSDPKSDDLVETASILVRRNSRRPVVDAIVSRLRRLEPTGGLLALPSFGWDVVFTTNFDQLIETAYSKCKIPIAVMRSNFDFSTREASIETKLYKIHGCITQDESLGHKASMILTEQDYESHRKYRQALFSVLQAKLMQGDVLVVGQSLRDRHLSDLVKDVLAAKQEGAPGHVYLLVYDNDDLRAPLFEDKGARIAFGGIDEFVYALATDFEQPSADQGPTAESNLPVSLVSTVRDATAEAKATPNVTRMFNGGPATYADIATGAVFERTRTSEVIADLAKGSPPILAITGAAGVGKTTFARQIVSALSEKGLKAWEHKSDFPFRHQGWIGVEAQLRASGGNAVLLLDECTHYMRQTNALVDHIAGTENPSLRIILTANSAQWAPRIKSPNIFSRGKLLELSRLEDAEINSLINLVEYNNDVSSLVHSEFKRLERPRKFQALRQKCSADMFVCLSNIFANESLDTILLREYEDLPEYMQDYYRYVAALEAIGMRVHRQLLIRMLDMHPAQVSATLEGLSGIVDEYDISTDDGIYGWATRHIVIARKITDYKFSSAEELSSLFEGVVNGINPAVSVELQSIRSICDSEFGIGRLGDSKLRQKLYRQLIEVAPGERIPRHRLIRELLNEESLDDTEYVIRDAEEAVGNDAPIDRFRVRLLMVRAHKTIGISEGDRVALLRKAYELAMSNIGRHKSDKFSYVTLCDVAVALVRRGESEYILEEAVAKMREAAEWILDPDMSRRLRHYTDMRGRLR